MANNSNSLLVSNSLNRVVEVYYRVATQDGVLQPMIKVSIQPRALCNTINFINEAHLEAFKRQADYLFKKGILIAGKATEEKLLNTNADLKENETKEKTATSDATIEKIQEAADNINAEVTMSAEPVARAGKRNKK